MIIFVNDKDEIKDVGVNSLKDETLTAKVINDEENPFADWSNAKICCYKATVEDGRVTMMTPYVDSRLIEHIDQLGRGNDSTDAQALYTALMTDTLLEEGV